MKPALRALYAAALLLGWNGAGAQALDGTPKPGTAAASAPAPAASSPEKPKAFVEALVRIGQVDLSVPGSPAFAVLGIDPTGIQRPGTVRELGAALTKGFDKNGKPKTGLAFDFAPLPLAAPQLIVGGKRYEADRLIQLLTRTTVSLATVDGTDGASRMAWGVRVGVFDDGDPGLFADLLASCVRSTVTPPPVQSGPTVVGATDAVNQKLRDDLAKCDPSKNLALWAKPSLYIGFGQSWSSATGALKDRTAANKAFWATYSIGRALGNTRVLGLLHAKRDDDSNASDPADATKFFKQTSTEVAARLRLGQDGWRASFDWGVGRVKQATRAASTARRYGAGLEFQIKEDMWLQMGQVTEKGWQDGASQRKVTAGLRFGSEPSFAKPGPGQ